MLPSVATSLVGFALAEQRCMPVAVCSSSLFRRVGHASMPVWLSGRRLVVETVELEASSGGLPVG